jgi:hypothetical protein
MTAWKDGQSEEWSPGRSALEAQDALGRLRIAEAALLEAQDASLARRYPVPDALWGLVMLALLGIILFANSLIAWLGPGAIWGGIAFASAVALFTVVDRRIRAAEIAAETLRQEAAEALLTALSQILDRNFVAATPDGRLVSTPDLDRLRNLEEALSLSDPDVALLGRIRGTILAVEGKLSTLLARPLDSWSDAGLQVDVAAYEREVDAL